MGTCQYCGKSAGLFRSKHSECVLKTEQGWQKMVNLVRETVLDSNNYDGLYGKLNELAEANFIKPYQVKESILKGWDRAVDHFLDDGSLDEDEEHKLTAFLNHFSLTEDDVDRDGAYSKIVKGAILRDLMNGKIPQRVSVNGSLPFNFQKSEVLLWLFTNVPYYEDKIRRQYVGGYQGVSMRIAKGLYYRVGTFRGHPVETTERVHVDTGQLAITNQHIYFAGANKSFRVRHSKIVSFTPYSDGVCIQRDAASAKPQTFITGDGWFTFNLLSNVNNV